METKYGIISDVHHHPANMGFAVQMLKNLGATKLILNGDISQGARSISQTQEILSSMLEPLAYSGLEVYVQPGSHEAVPLFQPIIEHFADKYDNIFTISGIRSIKHKDHHLLFIPGSDVHAHGGEYHFGEEFNGEPLESGEYLIKSEKGDLWPYTKMFPNESALNILKLGSRIGGFVHFANLNDVEEHITDPEKTIAFCHVPRKFDNLEHAVDVAYFAEGPNREIMPGIVIESQIRNKLAEVHEVNPEEIPYRIIQKIAIKNGINLRYENRGNELLKAVYDKYGIIKSVNGHFHESAHRACDNSGNHVQENRFVNELHWNASCLIDNKVGLLTVKDGQVSYRNIDFSKFLRSPALRSSQLLKR